MTGHASGEVTPGQALRGQGAVGHVVSASPRHAAGRPRSREGSWDARGARPDWRNRTTFLTSYLLAERLLARVSGEGGGGGGRSSSSRSKSSRSRNRSSSNSNNSSSISCSSNGLALVGTVHKNKPKLLPPLSRLSARDRDSLFMACAFTPRAALVT
ncbi:hypothetical protein GOODEAATRI_030660 [Goodea atripinnis]|uniref:Uncharacterized protein n=1 Tax=Goodea atripinnis TaxID=208336 RepID=A0ABV0PTI1_9TELE